MTAPDAASPVNSPKRRGRRPRPTPADGSREAKRLATAVLEVLAGTRSPPEAASSLEVSLPRYYAIETSAIAGLVAACEPRASTGLTPETELTLLRRKCQKLERENARYQALARIAQRAVGLSPPTPPKDQAGKKRQRRPRVRALQAISAIGSVRD